MIRRYDRLPHPNWLWLALAGALVAGCSKGGDKAGSGPPAGPSFALTVRPPAPGAAGGEFAATVQVEPKGIYKINLEYPTRLKVEAPTAAAPREAKLSAQQAAKLDKRTILFKPRFKIASAGEHAFKGTLRFSVCTPKQCELKREKVQWVTKVTE